MSPDPKAKDDSIENRFRAGLEHGPFTRPPLEGGGLDSWSPSSGGADSDLILLEEVVTPRVDSYSYSTMFAPLQVGRGTGS